MTKCRYCGKIYKSERQFCSYECEVEYKKALEREKHKVWLFWTGVAVSSIIILSGIALLNLFLIGAGFIYLGLNGIFTPLLTDKSVSRWGFLETKRNERIIGSVVSAIGLLILIIGFLI